MGWKVRESGSKWSLHSLGQAGNRVFALGENGTILQSELLTPLFTGKAVTFSSSGVPVLQIVSASGDNVIVERSLDMKQWTHVDSITNSSGLLRWADTTTNRTQGNAFYRASAVPNP